MLKKISWGFLLATFIVLTSPAWSQVGVSLGPNLGIQKAEDADESKYLVGATMRVRLMSALGAEGSINYRQEEFEGGAVEVKSWPVTVTGLLYPLPILYGGVGAGWYNTTFDFNEVYNNLGYQDRTEQEFGWHLGTGLELPLGSSASVFGDVRWVFLDYEFENLPSAVIDDVEADFYSINVGLLFNL